MINRVIIVDNTHSQLQGFPQHEKSWVNDLLKYKVPGAYFAPSYKKGWWDGYLKLMDWRTGRFPTGLLPQVLRLLDTHDDYEYQLLDTRVNLDRIIPDLSLEALELGGKELRDYQVDTINSVINNKLKDLPFQRGIINVATNGGKTLIACGIIAEALKVMHPNDMFLFLTHSKEIAYQVIERLYTDLGETAGMVGDGKSELNRVTVALIPTLFRWRNKKDVKWDEIAFRTIGYIGDECHHASSTSFFDVMSELTGAVINIGLTGTVGKEDDKVGRLHAVTGDVIVKTSNDFLVKSGYSAVPECYLTTIDYPDIDNTMRKFGQTPLKYPETYKKGIVENSYRNWIIAKIAVQEYLTYHGQTLILVEHIEHGHRVIESILRENADIRCQFIHGGLGSEERQEGLDALKTSSIDVLISTAILDEGVDVPNINAIIYARGGKSDRKVLQSIGRGLRKKEDGSNLRFYDFLDATSHYLMKHSKERYQTLKDEKFKCKTLKLLNGLKITSSDIDDFMASYDDAFDGIYQYTGV